MISYIINNIKIKNFNEKYILYLLSFVFFTSLIWGLYLSFFSSPEDYQQGIMVKVMYIHVPAAWMSLIIYTIMASSSFSFLIWRNPLLNIISYNSAPIGALFALITLITGSLWGKPIWGAWWVWDARLTSMLILFFFYIGYILLCSSLVNYNSNAPAILAIVGFINIPIVKFSVNLWNSLHQPASIIRSKGISIDPLMLKPLFIMFIASLFYYFTNLVIKVKIELISKKINRLEFS